MNVMFDSMHAVFMYPRSRTRSPASAKTLSVRVANIPPMPSTRQNVPTLISSIGSAPSDGDLSKVNGFDGVVIDVYGVITLGTIVGHSQTA